MLDFTSPLTTEAFDRTPEQRAQRTAILAPILQRGHMSHDDAQAETNRQMFDRFQSDFDALVAQRFHTLVSTELSTDGPGADSRALKLVARGAIMQELQELDQAFPYPGLERIPS